MNLNEGLIKINPKSIYFSTLINIINNDNINIVDASLKNILGFTTRDKIFIDLSFLINHFNEETITFIILHEIAHLKRIRKYSYEYILNNLINNNFEEFSDFIINEEIFCDRWATMMFYVLYGKLYSGKTQNLESKKNQKRYKNRLISAHDVYKTHKEGAVNMMVKEYVKYVK
jgi:hypothetical protein